VLDQRIRDRIDASGHHWIDSLIKQRLDLEHVRTFTLETTSMVTLIPGMNVIAMPPTRSLGGSVNVLTSVALTFTVAGIDESAIGGIACVCSRRASVAKLALIVSSLATASPASARYTSSPCTR
jgi:hypothetical protein